MQRTWAFLRSLWSSVAFRLTLNYGLLATITTLALLAFIYLQIIGALHSQVYSLTATRAHHLLTEYDRAGRQGVIRLIDHALLHRLGTESEVYLYLDEQGVRLAGNLDADNGLLWPPEGMPPSEIRIQSDGKEIHASLQTHALPDGSTLIVGRELQAVDEIKAMIGRAGLAAIVVALVLVAAGTYIFRQELELRVGTIRRTAAHISSGHLRRRIPTTDSDDEFTKLSRDINHMLDRLETLMHGVRHVTDTIAHNLRTPMMRILGRLRTAQRPGTPSAERFQAAEFAIQEIENLTNLFDKLLQIAEIEAGTQRQNFTLVDLHQIAADVVDLYEPLAEDRGLHLMLTTTRRIHVNGDPDLLASAIANVVDNAVKYARSRVTIKLTTQDRNSVCVRIQDDGPGIPVSERPHIGRHFYRLDHSKEGVGLGLTSVRAIAGLHNGKLELVDADPGLIVILRLAGRT